MARLARLHCAGLWGKYFGTFQCENGTLGLRPGEATLEDLLREVKADISTGSVEILDVSSLTSGCTG